MDSLKVMAGDGGIDGAAVCECLKTLKIFHNLAETFGGIPGV